MLQGWFGDTTGRPYIEGRLEPRFASGKIESLAAGQMGLSTSEVGDLLAGYAGE